MSKPDDKGLPELDLVASKREFIETFFKRGAEFTEELMRENERLRFRLAELEQRHDNAGQEPRRSSAGLPVDELRERLDALEHEREALIASFRGVEAENKD